MNCTALKKESAAALLLFTALYLPFIVFVCREGLTERFSIDRFLAVFDIGAIKIFGRSITYALVSSVLSVLCGFVISLILFRTAISFRRVFLFLLLLPVAIPPFVYIEGVLYLSKLSDQNLFSPLSMILVTGLVYMPVSAIIISIGMLSVPKNIEESAILSFAGNAWFYKITLPWLQPFIISAFLISFIFTFSNYEIPSLMNVQTYTLTIFNQFGAYYNYLDTLYLILPVIALYSIVVIVTVFVMRGKSFFQVSLTRSIVHVKLTKFGKTVAFIVLIGLSIMTLFPFVVIVKKITGIAELSEIIIPYWKEVLYSLIVSCLAGVVALVPAILVVRSMVLFSPFVRSCFFLLALFPFTIPPSLIAISLIRFSSMIPGSNVIMLTSLLIFGLSARFFPVVVFMLYAGTCSINPHLVEAGMLQSRSWLQNLFKIWIPLQYSLICKTLLVFVLLTLGEIGLAVLLVPPDYMTASVNIYSMLHYGFGSEVASETFLLICIVIIAGYFILNKKSDIPKVTLK